jgi:phage shock protein PspC (stress-responsive transcriptional regulator)
MCRGGPRSQAGFMNTTDVNPEARTTQSQPRFAAGPDRIPLRRPLEGRMLAGVAAGLAGYFGVDVTIIRIAFVVLTVVGGAGIPLYLAGLLLIPEQGSDQSIAGSLIESLQSRSR